MKRILNDIIKEVVQANLIQDEKHKEKVNVLMSKFAELNINFDHNQNTQGGSFRPKFDLGWEDDNPIPPIVLYDDDNDSDDSENPSNVPTSLEWEAPSVEFSFSEEEFSELSSFHSKKL